MYWSDNEREKIGVSVFMYIAMRVKVYSKWTLLWVNVCNVHVWTQVPAVLATKSVLAPFQ